MSQRSLELELERLAAACVIAVGRSDLAGWPIARLRTVGALAAFSHVARARLEARLERGSSLPLIRGSRAAID